jgi:hypothetical protein
LAIVDYVVLDRERSHAWTELRTYAAHHGLFGQQVEALDDVVHESVGNLGTGVVGYV